MKTMKTILIKIDVICDFSSKERFDVVASFIDYAMQSPFIIFPDSLQLRRNDGIECILNPLDHILAKIKIKRIQIRGSWRPPRRSVPSDPAPAEDLVEHSVTGAVLWGGAPSCNHHMVLRGTVTFSRRPGNVFCKNSKYIGPRRFPSKMCGPTT